MFAGVQRYTIRDLNTGQLYVLDGDQDSASPDGPESPAAAGRVTDVIQGRQLSLDEFEQLLGLNAVLEVMPKPEHRYIAHDRGGIGLLVILNSSLCSH